MEHRNTQSQSVELSEHECTAKTAAGHDKAIVEMKHADTANGGGS